MTATRTPTAARKSWLTRLAGIFGRPPADRSPPAPKRRLSVEGLEDRMCPTGINLQTALAVEHSYGVGTAVAVLHNQLTTDAKQLGYDVCVAEIAKTTPLGSVIAQDAWKLYNDAYWGSYGYSLNSELIFSDTALLTTQMLQEYYGSGSGSLLGSNTKVQSETCGVLNDLITDAAFIQYNNYFAGMSTAATYEELLGFVPPSAGMSTSQPFGNMVMPSSGTTSTGGDLLNVMDGYESSLAMGTSSVSGTGFSPSGLLGMGGSGGSTYMDVGL